MLKLLFTDSIRPYINNNINFRSLFIRLSSTLIFRTTFELNIKDLIKLTLNTGPKLTI